MSFDFEMLDDAWFRFSRSPRKLLAKRLPDGAIVVDVGCGDLSRTLVFVHDVNPTLEIIGVEKFEDSTIYGRSILPEKVTKTGRMRRVACDLSISPMPFADATIDGVTCNHVIEHIVGKAELLREIARVLKPGGLFYIETPGPNSLIISRGSWLNRRALAPINYYDDETHLERPLSVSELSALVSDAGFVIVRTGFHRDFGRLGMPAYLLLFFVGLIPFVPRALAEKLLAAAWWNLTGWPIYALARKTASA